MAAVMQATPAMVRALSLIPSGRTATCTKGARFLLDPLFRRHQDQETSVQNQVAREVTFAVPLAGFGKAFDGAAIDPKALEEQQKKLQEDLEKRSDELRTRLKSSPSGAASPAAAPPTTAATPAPAAGQSPGGTTAPAVSGAARPPGPMMQITVSALTNKDLQRTSGDEIGDIERVVESVADGRQYIVVSSGGFLGLFDTEIVIPLENVTAQGNHILLQSMSHDQLKSLPKYDNSGNTYRELETGQESSSVAK
jgi:sporulation protein YlmC with PRC-barrel domain